MGTEENKAIVRGWADEVYNKGNVEVIGELLSPNFVRHTTGTGQMEMTGHPDVIALLKRVMAGNRARAPDQETTVGYMIAEGEWVVTQSRFTGTYLLRAELFAVFLAELITATGKSRLPRAGGILLPPGAPVKAKVNAAAALTATPAGRFGSPIPGQ